jgi:bifunctional non-homologous end joining protein LigD
MSRPTRRTDPPALPEWIQPQLTQLVDAAPDGPDWLHEIKFDGYRMHARLDRGAVRLLTRTGLDWTHKYPAIAAAVSSIGARQAYLDGELCEVRADGITSSNVSSALQYCDQQIGHGRAFHEKACAMSLEGIVSKRADAAYAPGNRGLWVKVKCLHREEFVVVAWTDQRF